VANTQYNTRWVLDTAESVVAAGTAIRIQALHFIGTGDDSSCILHDGNGKEIWKAKLGDVSVNGYQANISFGERGQVVDGLDLDTLTNGILYVYLARQ